MAILWTVLDTGKGECVCLLSTPVISPGTQLGQLYGYASSKAPIPKMALCTARRAPTYDLSSRDVGILVLRATRENRSLSVITLWRGEQRKMPASVLNTEDQRREIL